MSSPLPSYHNEYIESTDTNAIILGNDASPWIIATQGINGWWNAYNKALDENPLIAKALTSLFGFFFGDLFAQVRSQKEDRYSITTKNHYGDEEGPTDCQSVH
eukprot:CAMPEP_0204642920 /NCGR_PEP_ID=MMETSP0718-20130828/257_1 /ASSEMBLY_ACC=CAM_ASM_000674 /TAXON_ID=230516 /ORGANISM="Chaetoceros curvisetus" /LENGTH=102 /DNA_ID=CAMNT_0051663861 /DNA_START=98 /DNA_END=406 /DNA_ORIENTATION=+